MRKYGLRDRLTPAALAEKLYEKPKGMTFSEIGEEFGVSRQRIHQLFKQYKQEESDKEEIDKLFKEKVLPTKEEIQSLLDKNVSIKKIAEQYDLTSCRIKSLMTQHKLKKTPIKEQLNKETLSGLYLDQFKTDDEIATMYGCSKNTVMSLRYEHGIVESSLSLLKKRLTKEIYMDIYFVKGVKLHQIAELFNANVQQLLALKEEYDIEGEIKRMTNRPKKYRAAGLNEKDFAEFKNNFSVYLKSLNSNESDKNELST